MIRQSAFLIAFFGVLVPRFADATPGFPAEIQAHLALSYTPDCSICHVGAQQAGTATTPFAMTLKSYGLTPYNNASLDSALDAINAANISSAQDGIPDIQKLEKQEDPNAYLGDGGSAPVPFPPPDYGCQMGRARPSSGVFIAMGALALTIGLRRRSRR